jgi:hypothetical protein
LDLKVSGNATIDVDRKASDRRPERTVKRNGCSVR